ncbi:hypothetical protein CAC42_2414 [Sphaceloma murrayae]|uniref:Uncharacterized protein n=1 Tax=Sphaceloma murrayae TaxID=2082308 RepID=A0A2K1QW05_9PEZI|nr:hypothetical protein CAC42_2414 [Sphaceloma murrayae]
MVSRLTAAPAPSPSMLPVPSPPDDPWPRRPDNTLPSLTQHAISVLFLSLDRSTGSVHGLGYWQVANAYTAIALHDTYSGDVPGRNLGVVRGQVDAVVRRTGDCVNEFCDDSLWWGHLLLLLLVRSGEWRRGYERVCARIYRHVAAWVMPEGTRDGGGRDVGGAVLWKATGGCREVNSITTALWAEYCAGLALLGLQRSEGTVGGEQEPEGFGVPDARVLIDQAMDSLDCIFRCLYDEEEAVVYDTIRLDAGERVDWTFTYTTGQTISACVALHRAVRTMRSRSGHDSTAKDRERMAKSDTLLRVAIRMARKAMARPQWVEGSMSRAPGVLSEYGAYGPENHKAWQNDDAVGFKSVLVRSLGKMLGYSRDLCQDASGRTGQELSGLCEAIERFIKDTYNSLEANCTNGTGQYGPWWAGPMDMSTCHSQMAVLDVMAVMRLMHT